MATERLHPHCYVLVLKHLAAATVTPAVNTTPEFPAFNKESLKSLLDPFSYKLLSHLFYLVWTLSNERSCGRSQALGDQIIFVTRPDKKKILFYNDKHCQFTVDEGEN